MLLKNSFKIIEFIFILFIVFIFLFLFKESFYFLQTIPSNNFFSINWYPSDNEYGLSAMLLASCVIALCSLVISSLFSLSLALFTEFYCPPKLRPYLNSFLELCSGLPSVVYGLLGLTIIVPLILKITPPGSSLLAGIITLSLLLTPILYILFRTVLTQIPHNIYLQANALSLNKNTFIQKIILPFCAPQLLKSAILGFGRGLGETMALVMVCGNIPQIPSSLFSPVRTLSANMALEMSYALETHRSALFFSGFLLLLVSTILLILSYLIIKRDSNNYA